MTVKTDKKIFKIIYYAAAAIILLLYLIEAFIYPEFIQVYFKIPLKTLTLIAFLILGGLRLLTKVSFSSFIQKILTIASPLTLYLYMLLLWSNQLFYTNFSFSTFHLHAVEFGFFALVLTLVTVISWTKSFLITNKTLLTFASPWWSIGLMFMFSLYFESAFWHMEKEDSVTEWLTFFAYIAASYLSFQIFKKIKLIKNKPALLKNTLLLLFVMSTFSFLIIAGEEISWGQRIIGFDTPETLEEINTQGELNVHNNETVFQYVYLSYGLLGVYGSFSWIIDKFFKKISQNKHLHWFISIITTPKFLMGYFFPMIIYVIIRKKYGDVLLDRWEEFIELLLAVGILIFLNITLKKIQKSSLKNS